MFSIRNFQEQLQAPLERQEMRFLIRTFSTACGFFFFFAFLVWSVTAFLSSVSSGWVLGGLSSLVGWLLSIPMHLCSVKYRNNPLRASKNLVTTTYVTFTGCFMFLFLGITVLVSSALGTTTTTTTTTTTMAKLLFCVFGTTIAIYSVPAAIAFSISKKSTIINLSKFLWYCSICYIVLALISFFTLFQTGLVTAVVDSALAIVGTAILFLSPIITLYRMKTIVPYINYDDVEETKKWENYFVFEISFQLLQLALHVLRIVIIFFTSMSRSRLK